MTDAELIRAYAREESEEAFRHLVVRHLPLVYGAALRRCDGNGALAAEVAQQVFSTLARDAGQLETHRALPGWLYVTAKRAAGTVMRAETRRRRREQLAAAMSTLPGASDQDWEKLRPELDALLDELSENDRTVVILRFFSELSLSEISQTLDISADAARMRVDRALGKMRLMLEKRGIASTTAALSAALTANAASTVPVSTLPSITAAAAVGDMSAASGSLVLLMSSKLLPITSAAIGLLAGGYALTQYRENARLRAAVSASERPVAKRDEMREAQSKTAPGASPYMEERAGTSTASGMNPKSNQQLELLPKKIDTWANAGRGTPSAAFETALYGVAHGDFETTNPAIVFTGEGAEQLRAIFNGLSPERQRIYGTPEFMYAALMMVNRDKGVRLGGLEITSETSDAPDHVIMNYHWDNDPRMRNMPARRTDGQWVLELAVQGLDDPRRQGILQEMAEKLANEVAKLLAK